MKHLAISLLLACVSCGPVPAVAIEMTDDTISFTPAEIYMLTQCKAQGGCLWSRPPWSPRR